MAEVYVKHKKTYFLVKMAEFFCNAWLICLIVLLAMDIVACLAGARAATRYSKGFFSYDSLTFFATCVFFLLCRHLCKLICKKLEHHTP